MIRPQQLIAFHWIIRLSVPVFWLPYFNTVVYIYRLPNILSVYLWMDLPTSKDPLISYRWTTNSNLRYNSLSTLKPTHNQFLQGSPRIIWSDSWKGRLKRCSSCFLCMKTRSCPSWVAEAGAIKARRDSSIEASPFSNTRVLFDGSRLVVLVKCYKCCYAHEVSVFFFLL